MKVLFSDTYNNRVRKIDRSGMISTIAGNGEREFNGDGHLATSASLCSPASVLQYKNEIYIADSGNHRIRKIDQNGIISTIPKVRNNTICDYYFPMFIRNDELYFTDAVYQLFKIPITNSGNIQTIAGIEKERGFNGDDMLASKCKLNFPKGIFVDNDSQIFIADSFNNCIRKIDQNGMMRRVIGTAGQRGYSGDVPFDFRQYPHIGPRKKKPWIKPFPHAYHDLIVICSVELD